MECKERDGKLKMDVGCRLMSTIVVCTIRCGFFSNLISFVGSSSHERDEYAWHGYVYVAAMFFVASLRTVVLQQYWHICFYTGQQLRSAMVGIVYRKVC